MHILIKLIKPLRILTYLVRALHNTVVQIEAQRKVLPKGSIAAELTVDRGANQSELLTAAIRIRSLYCS